MEDHAEPLSESAARYRLVGGITAMRRYILRRLLLIFPTLLGGAVLVFVLMRVVPGDIVEMRFAEGQFFNAELVAKERARLGLDRPLWRQFLDWLWGLCGWILVSPCGQASLLPRKLPCVCN